MILIMTVSSFPDHLELDAQVPAAVPLGAGQWHTAAALLNVQDVRLQGDRVHRCDGLPEREDHAAEDRSQSVR